jgi:pyruvate,water dikinase
MLISSSFSKGIQPIVRGMLHYTRANAARREAMRSRVVDALDMLRKLFLECGRRMERAGVIKETEDAFFLTYEEIISWLRAPTQENYFLRVAVRRAQHALLQGLPEPPSTFLARGPEILAGEEQPKATAFLEPSSDHLIIKGIPTSGGRITGRARIMLDPAQDATLLPGEVLVAPYADIGWTPLFLTASALVVSLGGPLSHAAIVAREYGLPTVVNARGATAVIKTGDIVTVDGDLGRVYVSQTSTAESADE